MSAITVRGLPPEVERLVRRIAAEKRTSLNHAVSILLAERAGVLAKKGPVLHRDLDHLAGRWSLSHSKRFDRFLGELRSVDAELWK